MTSAPSGQESAFERIYGGASEHRWAFHDTKDPLTRYLRDRRIKLAMRHLQRVVGPLDRSWSVLVTCGGVGGEGTLLANLGFANVTVSDFSEEALHICRRRDTRLSTLPLNAERIDVPNESYDLVLVQDGLHHLPNPVLGFTEMLRVARHAVIVIEPYDGLVGRLLGTQWEHHAGSVNYVFRWTHSLLKQVTRSYLLQRPCYVRGLRIWDHNVVIGKLVRRLGSTAGVTAARALYAALAFALPRLGNMMVGVVAKDVSPPALPLTRQGQ